MEAIVLAGGLGTRLRDSVPDLPKCMAPVAGRPFIDFVIEEALANGVDHFIFSLGYKSEIITDHLQRAFPTLHYDLCIEDSPLGTGGAILAASRFCKEGDCIVLNGDTLFRVNLKQLLGFHQQQMASCTLALKPMQNFDRYGVVKLDNNGRIRAFEEKRECKKGLINGGVYALNINRLNELNLPPKFSFEKDFLEAKLFTEKIMALIQDSYFIDIGIPSDFQKAHRELSE